MASEFDQLAANGAIAAAVVRAMPQPAREKGPHGTRFTAIGHGLNCLASLLCKDLHWRYAERYFRADLPELLTNDTLLRWLPAMPTEFDCATTSELALRSGSQSCSCLSRTFRTQSPQLPVEVGDLILRAGNGIGRAQHAGAQFIGFT
jgi:hypothetical protein